MKQLLLASAIALLSSTAYAINDNNVINGSSVVGIGGSVNGSVINNGAGSGSTNLSNTSTNNNRSNASSNSSARQTQNARSSVDGSGNSSNVIEAQKRNPVSTAYAAPLVAADDTCMGSSSVGAQGVGLGLSVGSTWHDDDCVRRKDARELHNMGFKPAAIALMCQNAQIHKAMAAGGTPCPEATASDEAEVLPAKGWDDSAKH